MHFGGPYRLPLFVFGITAVLAGEAVGDPTDGGMAYFEKAIRPILVQHCFECHSAEAAARGKLQAGLALDSKQALLVGGESGPAIVLGDPGKSLLIAALRYESYEMPPTGRLPTEVIDNFVKWVAMGAPDPRDAIAAPKPRPQHLRLPKRIASTGRSSRFARIHRRKSQILRGPATSWIVLCWRRWNARDCDRAPRSISTRCSVALHSR